MRFHTSYASIIQQIQGIDPIAYAQSRNHLKGAVTYLSPYLSRGVISAKQVLDSLLTRGFEPFQIEKLVQELAWREYWQRLWMVHGKAIDNDFRRPQPFGIKKGVPTAIVNQQTGITAIDRQVSTLYETGYMHNHARMYVASLACNWAKCHWFEPARWVYYHLLDADWASNALSWQWVAGANSNKLYYANQENINTYGDTNQQGTFLDVSYEQMPTAPIPEVLEEVMVPTYQTPLPKTIIPVLNPDWPTLVYNFYNLDPLWREAEKANRILLLEPEVFEQYPVSQKSIDFCIALAQENIPDIQIWVASFDELRQQYKGEIYFKEHPLYRHYQGKQDARTWMTTVEGDYPSFFAYWKKCRKEIF